MSLLCTLYTGMGFGCTSRKLASVEGREGERGRGRKGDSNRMYTGSFDKDGSIRNFISCRDFSSANVLYSV